MNDRNTNRASNEEDRLLEHEYDGIKEYDNPLPRWWVWIFWGSCLFSVGYFFHYHLSGNGSSVAESYALEMREAREAEVRAAMGEKISDEALSKLMADAALMQDAGALFEERCMACHEAHGEGKIGPNLTDDYWLHGSGRLMEIYEVVSKGVPAKGMPAWDRLLTPIELRKLVAFVGTLRGKNLPGKPPEGTKVSDVPGAPDTVPPKEEVIPTAVGH
jgi:cytochrome c oxidase cbb3-type subunit 3